MIDAENQNVGRKIVEYATNYPLPKKMGQSAYRTYFNHSSKTKKQQCKANVFNMEVEAEKVFQNLQNKNNFKAETKGMTQLSYGIINEKLDQMKKRRNLHLSRNSRSKT